MAHFTRTSRFSVSAETLFAWHARPGAVDRLLPPWERVVVEERRGGIEGGRLVFRVPGPLGSIRWVAQHRDYVEGREFCDEQVHGPFARWVHRHCVAADGPSASTLTDDVEYDLPLGGLGRRIGGAWVERRLARMFAFRHRRTGEDLARHAAYADRPRLRVALTGAGGLVGRALRSFLESGGHRVEAVVRPGRADGIPWDPPSGRIDSGALEGVDAVVHLAGAPIADRRWTRARRAEIRASRVSGTALLATAIGRLGRRPRVLVSASAVGLYGDRGDEVLDETSAPGLGFLADVGRAWEAATEAASDAGIRVVRARLGAVLTASGGMLARLLPRYRRGAGGPIGGGRPWLSWISLDDAVGALHALLFEERLDGPVHVVSPNPVTQGELARTLGRVLARPCSLPVPAWVLRRRFGSMADEVLLASQRALPRRLEEAGFPFLHARLEDALRFELGRPAEPA